MSSNCVVELGQHIERNQRNILRQAHIRPNVSRTSGKSRANIPERAGLTFPRVLESLSIRNSSPAHAATGSSQPSTFRTSDTPLDATIHPSQPCVQRVCRDPCAKTQRCLSRYAPPRNHQGREVISTGLWLRTTQVEESSAVAGGREPNQRVQMIAPNARSIGTPTLEQERGKRRVQGADGAARA